MHSYIAITKLNDFIFCPRSLYFHAVYENFDTGIYHDKPQTKGKIKHESIDHSTYSSSKRYLQGLNVYCQKYGLMGKIDIYDRDKLTLIERKTRIKKIYDGYKYQLYAQYFGLTEMGYKVDKLCFHSLEDNKRYELDLPTGRELEKFEDLLTKIQNYDILADSRLAKPEKCQNCIYKNLCH
jgi:CRISPR-associated exonuclease Cas4